MARTHRVAARVKFQQNNFPLAENAFYPVPRGDKARFIRFLQAKKAPRIAWGTTFSQAKRGVGESRQTLIDRDDMEW